jgi:hypothetical protein
VALNPHSEQPDLSLPADYKADHKNEHPSDWGWHGEWGRAARVGGWIVAAILLVMMTATSYNFSGEGWLIIFAASLVVILIWDAQRRKRSWRK